MKKETYIHYERHHRKPRFLNGSNDEKNISMVKQKEHRAYHLLFGHGGNVNRTAYILNEVWIDPRYRLVVVERKQDDPNQLKMDL